MVKPADGAETCACACAADARSRCCLVDRLGRISMVMAKKVDEL